MAVAARYCTVVDSGEVHRLEERPIWRHSIREWYRVGALRQGHPDRIRGGFDNVLSNIGWTWETQEFFLSSCILNATVRY